MYNYVNTKGVGSDIGIYIRDCREISTNYVIS